VWDFKKFKNIGITGAHMPKTLSDGLLEKND
jgi:hypothetical protein